MTDHVPIPDEELAAMLERCEKARYCRVPNWDDFAILNQICTDLPSVVQRLRQVERELEELREEYDDFRAEFGYIGHRRSK